MRRQHLTSLTGLRFFAALHVLSLHLFGLYVGGAPGFVRNTVRSGYVGVSLFFVLSGFVLAYTYMGEEDGIQVSYRDFLAARVARIYPVYLLGILIAIPAFVRSAPHGGVHVAGLLWTFGKEAALIQSWDPRDVPRINFPGWSVSSEAFFYAVFPLAAASLARLRGRRLAVAAAVCWCVILVAPLLYLALVPGGAAAGPWTFGTTLNAVRFTPLIRLPEFILGVMLGRAFLLRRADARDGWATSGLAVVGILAVLFASARIPYVMLHNGLLAPLFALLIYSLALNRGVVARFLSWPVMVRLGEASYALYIVHVPMQRWATSLSYRAGLHLSPLGISWLAAVASIVVSLLILRFVEEPARRVIRRWLASGSRPHAAVPRPVPVQR